MNSQIRTIADLDRVIHEPGRLMVVALLSALERADFLYLLHEAGMNKGTLSSHILRLEEAGYVAVTKTYRGKVPAAIARGHAALFRKCGKTLQQIVVKGVGRNRTGMAERGVHGKDPQMFGVEATIGIDQVGGTDAEQPSAHDQQKRESHLYDYQQARQWRRIPAGKHAVGLVLQDICYVWPDRLQRGNQGEQQRL
jgi:hypothetical protein